MKAQEMLAFLDDFDKRFKTPFLKQKQIRMFFPNENLESFKVALCRLTKAGYIQRLLRGLYYNPRSRYFPNNFHSALAVNIRKSDTFYLSLESVLSENGIISQIPNRLVFISQDNSQEFNTPRGIIEFVHSSNVNPRFDDEIYLDERRGIYVATPERALKDAYRHRRFIDLIEEQKKKNGY